MCCQYDPRGYQYSIAKMPVVPIFMRVIKIGSKPIVPFTVTAAAYLVIDSNACNRNC